jgi:formyl-CoA transferase/CoA:oxalate CoA-transferase
MRAALEGITVIDCSRAVAGPYCGMLLGDLGANVIKIEAPEGDESREYTPKYGADSCYFLVSNRNKRSLTLNLKDEKSRVVLDRLLENADVFIENFRPQALARLGLTYDSMRERFPRLVYCSITGYGPTGPMSERPAMDAIIQAFSGVMSVTGEPGRPPVRIGVAMADLGTAVYAAYGILAALFARTVTGRGQKVETSLMESSVALACFHNAMYWGSGKAPERLGSSHAAMAPLQAFQASDGYMLVMAGNQKQWHALCDLIGTPELKSDSRFTTNADRVRNRSELHDILGKILIKQTRAEWSQRFAGSDVLHTSINTIDETVKQPQVLHRDMVIERPHPVMGTMKFTGFPIKFSDTPAVFRRDPPAKGEHTEEILGELGIDAGDAEILRKHGPI